MFWSIFWYMLGGLLILHFLRIQKLDTKNPNLKLPKIIWLYWKSERFYIITSIIGWIAFTNLLNAGLASVFVNGIFDYVIDSSNPTGVKAIAFTTGLSMQGVIQWISKRQQNSIERQLEKLGNGADKQP